MRSTLVTTHAGVPTGQACQPETNNLLPQYRDGDPFFFTSATETLHVRAQDVVERIELDSHADSARLPQRLASLREHGAPEPYAVGALPFDPAHPASFVLASDVRRAPGRCGQTLTAVQRGLLANAAGYHVHFDPPPARFAAEVESILEDIRRGSLVKAVAARALTLELQAELSPSALLQALAARCPRDMLFALATPSRPGTPEQHPHSTWVGASPELLLSKRGASVRSNPLAGSRPRGHDAQTDEAQAQALLHSAKDRHEHALVVDAVHRSLAPFCRELQVPSAPTLLATPTMWHLSTTIDGTLYDPDSSVAHLARALHPTPAVCGHPQSEALAKLRALEGERRGFFAGAVGYCNAQGDGEWAVTLRCAELTPTAVTLYAGAGVVEGSDPWLEYNETCAKMATVLQVLGVGLLPQGNAP